MPQFSIIVPVYNVQNYLAACVKSVAEQPGPVFQTGFRPETEGKQTAVAPGASVPLRLLNRKHYRRKG